MKENQTICQFLGITPQLLNPFLIKDDRGNIIYAETFQNNWYKYEYNVQNKRTRYEICTGYWDKQTYDSKGNSIYFENSIGYWVKKEFDSNGKEIYFENSEGIIVDSRPNPKKERADQIRLAADIIEFGHKWKAVRTRSDGHVQNITSENPPFSVQNPLSAIEIGYTISLCEKDDI